MILDYCLLILLLNHNQKKSRPLLIFNHNAKAGGGSIQNLLEGFKSHTVTCGKNEDNNNNESGCNSKAWDTIHCYENQNQNQNTNTTTNTTNNNFPSINNILLLVNEAGHTTSWDKQNGFIIGTVLYLYIYIYIYMNIYVCVECAFGRDSVGPMR